MVFGLMQTGPVLIDDENKNNASNRFDLSLDPGRGFLLFGLAAGKTRSSRIFCLSPLFFFLQRPSAWIHPFLELSIDHRVCGVVTGQPLGQG